MTATDRLDEIANGFQAAKILLAAAELRLFDLLRGPGAPVEEIADQIESNESKEYLDLLSILGSRGYRVGFRWGTSTTTGASSEGLPSLRAWSPVLS